MVGDTIQVVGVIGNDLGDTDDIKYLDRVVLIVVDL